MGGVAENGKVGVIGQLVEFRVEPESDAWDKFATDGSTYAEPELIWDEEQAEEGYDCPRCGEWIPAHRQGCARCGLDTRTLRAD